MKSKSIRKKLAVLNKTRGHCYYCGRSLNIESMCFDHVLAKSNGGTNIISNLVPCCRSCNSRKGSKSIEEFREHSALPCGFTPEQVAFLMDVGVYDKVHLKMADIVSNYKFWHER